MTTKQLTYKEMTERVTAEINEKWKAFYQRYRLKQLVEGRFAEAAQEFLSNLHFNSIDVDEVAEGEIRNPYVVGRFHAEVTTSIKGKEATFRIHQISDEFGGTSMDWVSGDDCHLDCQDMYEGEMSMLGEPLLYDFDELDFEDAEQEAAEAEIQYALFEFELLPLLESQSSEMVEQLHAEEEEHLASYFKDPKATRVKKYGDGYQVSLENGLSFFIEDGTAVFPDPAKHKKNES